jgi:hypothetical protein
MNETIELLDQELKRYPSKRRKKVLKLATPKLISQIESEIIKINSYLIGRIINERGTYRPETGDKDQPLRDKANYLMDLVKRLKSIH